MKKYTALALIFLLAFAIRLPFMQFEPSFGSFEILREVQHVVQTGEPLSTDALSYGGRERIAQVALSYILALASGWSADPFLLQLVLALLGAAVVLPVYVLLGVKSVKESHRIALTAFAGLMPLFVQYSTYSIGSAAISILVHLSYIVIFFLKKSKRRTVLAIFMPIIASAISPSFFIILLGLLIYITIQKIEHRRVEGFVIEQTIYGLSIYTLITYVLYKQGLIAHGLQVFEKLVYPTIAPIGHINILFIFMTIYMAYRCFFHTHRRSTLLITSFLVSAIILGLLNVVTTQIMVLHLNFLMLIISGLFLDRIRSYMQATNFSKYTEGVLHIFVFILLITWVLPFTSLEEPSATTELIDYLETVPQDSVVLTDSRLAPKIMFTTGLQTFGEKNTALVSNADEYFSIMSQISSEISQANVLRKLQIVTTKRPLYIITPDVPDYSGPPCFNSTRLGDFTLTEVTCQKRD